MACETLLTTGLVLVAGEITTSAVLDVPQIVRGVVRDIGYTSSDYGFDAETCAVNVALGKQSPDIAQGVDAALETRATGGDALDRIGAGDQGMMFGFACDETPQLMPLPLMLAHAVTRRLAAVRRDGTISDLLPGRQGAGHRALPARRRGRARGGRRRARGRLLAAHGAAPTWTSCARRSSSTSCASPIPVELLDDATLRGRDFVLVNPTGRFEVGGPMGDAGLTGRKIIVDTYGGMARHGGGAFSGKDPTKVDRSAAYACRWVAKNIVAAGPRAPLRAAGRLRHRRRAPGEPQRRDVRHGAVDPAAIAEAVREHFDLRPAAILRDLDLRRPIYRATAAYGHFGRDQEGFPWERTDRAEALGARSHPRTPALDTVAALRARVRDDPVRHDPAVSPPRTVRVVPLVTTRALREPLDYLAARGRRARARRRRVRAAGRAKRARRRRRGGRAVAAQGRARGRRAARRGAAHRAGRARAVPLDRGLLRLDAGPCAGPRAAAARARAARHVGLGDRGATARPSAGAALLAELADGPLPMAELVERAGTTQATVRRLAKDGLLDARCAPARADGRRRAARRGPSR